MLSFASDYAEGAHERILKRLLSINAMSFPGYGEDAICVSAAGKIRDAFGCPDGQVFFLVGGTQTNAAAISTVLQSYEGVIAAQTGHIACHEAGAIEHAGRKVIALPQDNGKLRAADVASYLAAYAADENREHVVAPGMVYLSQPTEYGTLYTRAELEEMRKICSAYGVKIYVDGARLCYALGCEQNDVDLKTLSRLADLFSVGGTKAGALFGEALVFPRGDAPSHMKARLKQRGALPAKGWLLGLQFDELFEDGLYAEIGRNAVRRAQRIKAAFAAQGYPLLVDAPTNQVFPVFSDEILAEFAKNVSYSFWEKTDETHTAVRLAVGFAADDLRVDALIALLDRL